MATTYQRRWLTPAEWVRTRRLMRRNAIENQSVCGACGTYLTYGYHWHYVFRWVSGWRTW
jgi:hypothetical protein